MYTESQNQRDEQSAADAQATPTPPSPLAPPTPEPVPAPTPKPPQDITPQPEPIPSPQPQPAPEPPQLTEPEPALPPEQAPIVEPPPQPQPEAAPVLRHPAPGAVVTQWFGKNPRMYKQWGLAGHEGIDFGCRIGTAVSAAAPGKVIICGPSPDDGPLGTRVVLEHRWGDAKGYSIYAHFSEIADNIAVGKIVAAGDKLGKSGDTGNVTGPHLHFALLLRGQALDGFRGPRDMGDVWWHDPKPYIVEFQVAGFPDYADEVDHDHVCGGPPIDSL